MEPIKFDATPTPAQLAAGIRQWGLIIGSALGALGLFPGIADWLEKIGSPELAGAVGVVATVIAFVWGQVSTRKQAKKLAVAGSAAPDTVAVPK